MRYGYYPPFRLKQTGCLNSPDFKGKSRSGDGRGECSFTGLKKVELRGCAVFRDRYYDPLAQIIPEAFR